MKRLFAITFVILLSSGMFLAGAYAGDGEITKSLSGMWNGTIYQVGYCVGSTPMAPIFMTVNIGKGVSTLTGNSDWYSVDCGHCSVPSSNPPLFCDELSGSGWGIVTSSNGDQLHLDITRQTVNLTDNPPTWIEEETIVGGTGMFEGVSGESDSLGTWTSGTNPFPYGTLDPQLVRPPQGWVGTNEGSIRFSK